VRESENIFRVLVPLAVAWLSLHELNDVEEAFCRNRTRYGWQSVAKSVVAGRELACASVRSAGFRSFNLVA
jgi:hypothetical protein